MVAHTKHKIDDEVYIVSGGRLIKVIIANIKVEVGRTFKTVQYGWIGATTYYFNENECWETPEEFVEQSKIGRCIGAGKDGKQKPWP